MFRLGTVQVLADEGSAAYLFGYLVGQFLVIALVVLVIIKLVRWSKRAGRNNPNPQCPVPSGFGPPPGWYPDPSGGRGFRWWDGARWTDQVHDGRP